MVGLLVPVWKAKGRRERGFTLVELLVVIAIIALLTAILLPVLAGVRENGRRTKCRANLHDIALALKLYKQDNGGYPPGLFGDYVLTGGAWGFHDPSGGAGLRALYPNYVTKEESFLCPDDPDRSHKSSYDVQDYSINSGASTTAKYTYTRVWAATTAGSVTRPDYRQTRQLILRSAPDDTVMTWCIYHRSDPTSSSLKPSDMDIVAFIDGDTKVVTAGKGHAYTTSGTP